MKEFTQEELSQFDGRDGKPVYVAYQGRVVDVTASKLWKTGTHMRRHHAGTDLTADLSEAPHNADVLGRYTQVGILKSATAPNTATPVSSDPSSLLSRFPFLRRHPHPMTVHFPIAFLIAAPVFLLIYLASGITAFEQTAWHCLGAAFLMTPVAIATGLATWKINYMAQPIRPVMIKLVLSPLAWLLASAAFFWRLADPGIATDCQSMSLAYVALVLIPLPLVSLIGWLGAMLTFPPEPKGR